MQRSSVEQRLALLYLANDALQNGKKKQLTQLVDVWTKPLVRGSRDPVQRSRMRRSAGRRAGADVHGAAGQGRQHCAGAAAPRSLAAPARHQQMCEQALRRLCEVWRERDVLAVAALDDVAARLHAVDPQRVQLAPVVTCSPPLLCWCAGAVVALHAAAACASHRVCRSASLQWRCAAPLTPSRHLCSLVGQPAPSKPATAAPPAGACCCTRWWGCCG